MYSGRPWGRSLVVAMSSHDARPSPAVAGGLLSPGKHARLRGLGPQPGGRGAQPVREPVAHEPEEQVVEGSVGLHGLQLAGFGAVGVVAVVGDEAFQPGQFLTL